MSVPLKFFQTNLMHSFSAALNLAQLILGLDLDVILIQEPYAKSTRFSPLSYNPFLLATPPSIVSLKTTLLVRP